MQRNQGNRSMIEILRALAEKRDMVSKAGERVEGIKKKFRSDLEHAKRDLQAQQSDLDNLLDILTGCSNDSTTT